MFSFFNTSSKATSLLTTLQWFSNLLAQTHVFTSPGLVDYRLGRALILSFRLEHNQGGKFQRDNVMMRKVCVRDLLLQFFFVLILKTHTWLPF